MFCLRTKAKNDKDGFNIHQIHLPRLVFGSLSPALLGSPGIFVFFFFFKNSFSPPEAINKWLLLLVNIWQEKMTRLSQTRNVSLGVQCGSARLDS